MYEEALEDGREMETEDCEKQPAALQIDFTTAYQQFSRAKAYARIKQDHPRMLRFFIQQYYEESQLMMVWDGKKVLELPSTHGSQQGDIMGGFYFQFGTLDFAEELARTCPDAHIAWIVDDLTVAATGKEALKVAQFVKDVGPQHGLHLSTKEDGRSLFGYFHDDETGNVPEWADKLNQDFGYELKLEGFRRLLGAPLGWDNFCATWAKNLVVKKLASVKHLRLIQHAHLETNLLRHGYAARVTHLLRLVKPKNMGPAIEEFNKVVISELARLCATTLGEDRYQFNKRSYKAAILPVRHGGIGIPDLKTIAPGAYCAAVADAARTNKAVVDTTRMKTAKVVQEQIQRDVAWQDAATELKDTLGRDTTNNATRCPEVTNILKTPTQNQFSKALLKFKAQDLIDSHDTRTIQERNRHDGTGPTPAQLTQIRTDKMFFKAQQESNAGAQFRCVPCSGQFLVPSQHFRVMLCRRLRVEMRGFEGRKCQCGADLDAYGDHVEVCSKLSAWSLRHNRLAAKLAEFVRQTVKVDSIMEPLNLVPGASYHRPADFYTQFPNEDKPWAQDVAIVTPMTKGNIASAPMNPNVPLKSMALTKINKDAKVHQALGHTQAQAAYVKKPIVFSTFGACGAEALEWFKHVAVTIKQDNGGRMPTMAEVGIQSSWGITGVMDYLRQMVAMCIAKHVCERVWKVRYEEGGRYGISNRLGG